MCERTCSHTEIFFKKPQWKKAVQHYPLTWDEWTFHSITPNIHKTPYNVMFSLCKCMCVLFLCFIVKFYMYAAEVKNAGLYSNNEGGWRGDLKVLWLDGNCSLGGRVDWFAMRGFVGQTVQCVREGKRNWMRCWWCVREICVLCGGYKSKCQMRK